MADNDTATLDLGAFSPDDPYNSLMDPSITYVYDNVSCIAEMWYFHIIASYVVFFSGLACFATRVVLKNTHAFFGRVYVIAMLWATATSVVIHNNGLPPATLVSFLIVLGGMTIAWFLIKVHSARLQSAALAAAEAELAAAPKASSKILADAAAAIAPRETLESLVARKKWELIQQQSFLQRFLSLPALHGILMFTSWINIAGRVFVTPVWSVGYACRTYPMYKPIGEFVREDGLLELVPPRDPGYDDLPWAAMGGWRQWGVVMSVGPAVGAALVGAVWSLVTARAALKRGWRTLDTNSNPPSESGNDGDHVR